MPRQNATIDSQTINRSSLPKDKPVPRKSNRRLRVAKFMKNDFLKNLFIIKKIFGFLSIKAFDDFIYQTAC